MTDIIAPGSDATREDLWRDLIAARAEIERLQCWRAEHPYSELDLDMHVAAVTKDLRSDIERLRSTTEISPVHVQGLQADNARLKIESNERVVKLLAQIVAMQAENERLRTRYDSATDQAVRYAAEIGRLKIACRDQAGVELSEENDRLIADIEQLKALLGKLRWKSIDKDNMEFRCDTTCYVMDEIRRVLETKP